MSRVTHEAGSASPLTVAMIAVVMVIAAAATQVGAGLVAQARAGGAADLAALAAARTDRDLRSQGVAAESALDNACDVAQALSARNGAIVTQCARGSAGSVVVSVSMPVRGWPRPVNSSSRAGPAWG